MDIQTDNMHVHYFDEEFPYIIVDNTYNEHELDLIWEELNFLCYRDKLESNAKIAGSATRDDGSPKKNNMCIFLDSAYGNRKFSNILKVNRKFFDDGMSIIKNHPNWFFSQFVCNRDTSLISYYENSNYYESHHDECIVTILTWFYKEPKKFNGGDINLHFEDKTIKIQCLNNRSLIIPSMINHSVDEIEMLEDDMNKKLGRICMSQFLTFQN